MHYSVAVYVFVVWKSIQYIRTACWESLFNCSCGFKLLYIRWLCGSFSFLYTSTVPTCSVSSKATTHSMQFFVGKFIFLTHDHNTEWKESSCILDMPEDGSLCWLFSVWHFCVGNYRVYALVEWNVSTVLRAGLCHYLSTLWNCVLYHKQLFLSTHTHARTHHCMYIRTCSCTDVSSFSSNDLI